MKDILEKIIALLDEVNKQDEMGGYVSRYEALGMIEEKVFDLRVNSKGVKTEFDEFRSTLFWGSRPSAVGMRQEATFVAVEAIRLAALCEKYIEEFEEKKYD